MIEYNGILAEDGLHLESMAALLAALKHDDSPPWRDLYLSGIPAGWSEICTHYGVSFRLLRHPQAAPLFNFEAVAADDILDALSRNSRHQIRRSLRLYAERGPITLMRAQSADEAIKWLDELASLHTAHWNARGEVGAFSSSTFSEFHKKFISESFAADIPDLLCARAGEHIIGYLYNLRWRGVVCAYQSGFNYEPNGHLHPGLVTHALAMRKYRNEAISAYKFLAGDEQYKRTLSNACEELLWAVTYRPDVSHMLENFGRRVRSLVRIRHIQR